MELCIDLPDWVRGNPEKYHKRLIFEAERLAKVFPRMGYCKDGDTLSICGPLVSTTGNEYQVEIVYPKDYPLVPARSYMKDEDVLAHCAQYQLHSYHNYGRKALGLELCLQDASKWVPVHSGISVVEFTAVWILGYEFKKIRGYWPFPE